MTDLTSPAPVSKDVSTKDFVTEVVRASMTQPVIVDFWAPWCGPCKQLTPVLEKAVSATQGKVKLVKVDIDQNEQLAAQMGIQSIPAVYAFYKGQPLDGFLGVQPEGAIRAFIDKLLKVSGGGALGAAVAEALAEADGLLEKGDLENANAIYAEVLGQDALNAAAYAGLIKVALAMGQPDEAAAMLAEAPPEVAKAKELAGVRAQLDLLKAQAEVKAPLAELERQVLATPDDPQPRYDLALALQLQGRSEEAMDQLLEIIRRNRSWNDDAARKQLLVIFEALGPMHELVVAARRKLSGLLFR